MSDIDSSAILKAYLGPYYVKPIRSKALLGQIRSDVISSADYSIVYQVAGLTQFRQVVQAIVLSYEKRIVYQVAESYTDVIERYIKGLNRESDPEAQNVLGSLTKPDLLIIYVPKQRMVNKQMIPLCVSIAESRSILSRKTFFVVFQEEPGFDKFPYHNLLQINGSAPSITKSSSLSEIL